MNLLLRDAGQSEITESLPDDLNQPSTRVLLPWKVSDHHQHDLAPDSGRGDGEDATAALKSTPGDVPVHPTGPEEFGFRSVDPQQFGRQLTHIAARHREIGGEAECHVGYPSDHSHRDEGDQRKDAHQLVWRIDRSCDRPPDLAARRVAVRVEDATARVRGLLGEGEVALLAVELRAVVDQLEDVARPLLDEHLNPYPDDRQWSVLADVKRISLATIERIAEGATRTGTVVGLRIPEAFEDDEDAAPWTRAPSGVPRVRSIAGPLPTRVSGVLAQRLFVAKEGLPSPLLNQIKRLAAFQNPEFYKKQSMRLSTATTPRVIACQALVARFISTW